MIPLLLLTLLLVVSPAWAQRPGTLSPFMGLVYGENQEMNTNWSTIDSFMCGGASNPKCQQCTALQPCNVQAPWTFGGPVTFTGTATFTGPSIFSAPINAPVTIQGTAPAQIDLTVAGVAGQTGDLQDWKLTAADAGPTTYVDQAGTINLTALGTASPVGKLSYDTNTGAVVLSQVALVGKFRNNTGANFRNVSGCFTAATVGAQCTTHLGWQVAFTSAQYNPVCTCEQQQGVPILYILNKTTAGFDLVTTAVTAAAAQCSQIDCIAFAN